MFEGLAELLLMVMCTLPLPLPPDRGCKVVALALDLTAPAAILRLLQHCLGGMCPTLGLVVLKALKLSALLELKLFG